MDKLKEIRDRVEQTISNGAYAKCGALNGVAGMMCDKIQTESYNLGCNEVIEEIEKMLPAYVYPRVTDETLTKAIYAKLNQLKQ